MQKANDRWNDLGAQIEEATQDVGRYRHLNYDLMFASDKNRSLRARNQALMDKKAEEAAEYKSIIKSMRADLE